MRLPRAVRGPGEDGAVHLITVGGRGRARARVRDRVRAGVMVRSGFGSQGHGQGSNRGYLPSAPFALFSCISLSTHPGV